MAFNPEDIAYADIYPPINVARVGDSSEHFIGSEVPGVEPIPNGGFKDSENKIKKQAARYRVYAFDKDSKALGEITGADYDLKWRVHVANKKAAWVIFRGKYRPETWELRNASVQGWPEGQEKTYEYTNTRTDLIIDPGEKVIEGVNAKDVFLDGKFGNDKEIPLQKDVRLGELRTDDQGRLLVLASDGHSFSAVGDSDKDLDSEFDNDGWVDKVCDGTVHVTVKSKSQPDRDIPVKNRATIITGPPRFSSGTHAPTTLYELIEEVYERPRRREAGDAYDVGDVVFYRDIYPMFKRIYLLSWTNNQNSIRNHHGPNKMKYFAGPLFSDPTKDNRKRANLLDTRIRAPVIDKDEANEKLRAEQASNEFMPLLGGDDSEPEEGKPNRWASLTQLQYDRLKKWAGPEKNFTTGVEEVPYESFDKIPLDEQPSALTKAGLEWSIGAPMYPGIEVYWVAQRDESYKPGERFRFADTVTPGDLTKGLALPWQSDFSMCNTHWWPSIRPDDVVAETYFDQLKADTKPDQLDQLAGKLKDRVRWARGVENDDENKQNSEMVRKWNKLGFVARQDYGGQLEIHIERQRTL